jgi:uncharacterized protein YbdZ (MbtH family)
MPHEEEDPRNYKIVVNHEEQYSIWFADRECPAGWVEIGFSGKKVDCLGRIKEVWTDMRPLSLRRKMAELERNPPPPEPSPPPPPRRPDGMNDLVARLQEAQPIEASIRPERLVRHLKESIDRGLVFVRFTNTGTELGVRLDPASCEFSKGDFAGGQGAIELGGTLTLNYNRVRFRGTLDLATLTGSGRLEFIEEVRPGRA